jgi:DNA adenine methylase
MSLDYAKVPFPWFGGKQHAAPLVWAALGDVDHYVEPFCGSLAVLLRRPDVPNRTYHSETVNDMDGLLVNAWRAIQLLPYETAEAASWPVSEADLHARHSWLLRWKRDNDLERLMGDPTYCDPLAAGWWIWGQSSWIGSGWCSGQGPWVVDEHGRFVRRPKNDGGVKRKLPHLGDDGKGANRPQLRIEGVGTEPDWHPMTMPELRNWFGFLSARLRHVRILNGDWTRATTGGATKTIGVRMGGGHAGIFLDPPYADTAERADSLYSHDSLDVAHKVREWCIKNGDDPSLRIVLAGFVGEHDMPDSWLEVEWYKGGFLRGGMGNTGEGGQQHKERLWLSPHCIRPKALDAAQGSLFGVTV